LFACKGYYNLVTNLNKMKCVILCGGLGTRFSEETDVKPKLMIEINGKILIFLINIL